MSHPLAPPFILFTWNAVVAKLLNRNVILPKFHCYIDKEPSCFLDSIFDPALTRELDVYENAFLHSSNVPAEHLRRATLVMPDFDSGIKVSTMKELMFQLQGFDEVPLLAIEFPKMDQDGKHYALSSISDRYGIGIWRMRAFWACVRACTLKKKWQQVRPRTFSIFLNSKTLLLSYSIRCEKENLMRGKNSFLPLRADCGCMPWLIIFLQACSVGPWSVRKPSGEGCAVQRRGVGQLDEFPSQLHQGWRLWFCVRFDCASSLQILDSKIKGVKGKGDHWFVNAELFSRSYRLRSHFTSFPMILRSLILRIST